MTSNLSATGMPDLSGVNTVSPEDHVHFRLAQLLLLLNVVAPPGEPGFGLERLGYYDFFAANPFLVVQKDDINHTRLILAGFYEEQLSYASTGQRFANRRRKLQHDIALLVAYGLVVPCAPGWRLTEQGLRISEGLCTLYSLQYQEGVRIVKAKLDSMTEGVLARNAQDWLRSPSLILDLYGAATPHDSGVGDIDE